jgi:hypothetical protein
MISQETMDACRLWPDRIWAHRGGLSWDDRPKAVPAAECEYVRADAFPVHIDQTFKAMQEQIAKLKTRVAELELTEIVGSIEL